MIWWTNSVKVKKSLEGTFSHENLTLYKDLPMVLVPKINETNKMSV